MISVLMRIRNGLRFLTGWEESCPAGEPIQEQHKCESACCPSLPVTTLPLGGSGVVSCLTDPDHPRAASWVELEAAIAEGARALGVADSQFGRRLPGLLRSSGLVDVRSTATYDISASGTEYRRFDELTWISARAAVEHIPGVTAEQIDGAIDAARDPTFEYGEMTMVRAVGYRA